MKSVYKQAVVALAVLVALNAHAAAPVSDLGGDSGGGVVLSGNNGAIVPTGSLEDRVALLERTLNARLRLQAEQLSIVSYGEEKPLDLSHTEDAFAKNRRAVLVY